MVRFEVRWVLAGFYAVLALFFQNCSDPVFSTTAGYSRKIFFSSSIGGTNGGFDGMVFRFAGRCHMREQSGKSGVVAALRLSADLNSVTLIRDNCVDLEPVKQIGYDSTQFTFTTIERRKIRLLGRIFEAGEVNSQMAKLIMDWKCALEGVQDSHVAVLRDQSRPEIYYSQYKGHDASGREVVTDMVRAKRTASGGTVYFDSAQFAASLAESPPYIGLAIPQAGTASVLVQNSKVGVIQRSCQNPEAPVPLPSPTVSPGPSATPIPSPAPSATPTPTPAPKWLYIGQAGNWTLAALGAVYCGTEFPQGAACSSEGGYCWIYTGSYDMGGQTIANFFQCR